MQNTQTLQEIGTNHGIGKRSIILANSRCALVARYTEKRAAGENDHHKERLN